MTERDLPELARDLERLEEIVHGWEPERQRTVQAVRETLEAIQKGAFLRMIRAVREEPGGLAGLKAAVQDPWVQGVLGYHGLIRAPEPLIEARVEAALEAVRPTLVGHQGNVELVTVVSPAEVHIRLTGSCDGCTHSDVTVRMGIEAAIKERVPSVETVKVVDKRAASTVKASGEHGLVRLRAKPDASPFAKPWQDGGPFGDLPEGGTRAVELPDASVLVARARGELRAYPNACPHLGMPLDGAHVEEGVLECRYHGFRFVLATGECLTAPDVRLVSYPVRLRDGRIEIQVTT